mmetsp:Transcript_10050/g.27481  ORF Transcript_10050/g.27481 Transcript_10050/m.27481 type:complete len:219 (-) Transcript_10050:2032-2688(-)
MQRAMHEAHQDLLSGQVVEGHLEGPHLPHAHPHGPHVALLAHLRGVGHQLRGHIGQRATQVMAGHKVLKLGFAQAKISDFDQHVLPLPLHQQIVWLEVEVNNRWVLVMQIGHAQRSLQRNEAALPQRERLTGLGTQAQALRQRPPAHMLHHDAGNNAVASRRGHRRRLRHQAKHADDVGVVQASQHFRFAHEALAVLCEAVTLEPLDSNCAVGKYFSS